VKRSSNSDKGTGQPRGGHGLSKQNPTPPKSTPGSHVPKVSVPSYNLQRPRWIEKKPWWRWGLAIRWRKVIQTYLGSILRVLRMNTQIPNINVVRSAWRRVKKGRIEVRDLKPATDVKGGGAVKGEPKSKTGGTSTKGTAGSHS
jgi:hypothetical protein